MPKRKLNAAPSAKRSWPAEKIEHWPTAKLKPYDRNSRAHTEGDIGRIAASITRFGFTLPILVDERGQIIAGHARHRAAQKLKLATVPVIVAKGWTEDEKAAYCIADNQLAARATWDFEVLQDELKRLQGQSFELGVLGFDLRELNRLLAPNSGQTNPDSVPAVQERAITRVGDIWLLGPHRVHCGDSTDAKVVAAAFGTLVPKLMVADPPYGVDYDPAWRARKGAQRVASGRVLNDDRADWRDAWANFSGDVAYVWHGALHTDVVAESLRAVSFELRSQIVWVKQHFAFSRGDYHWQHEACWYAVREGAKGGWAGDRKQTTVWEFPNNNPFGNPKAEETLGHGTQKPIECMRRPIINNSEPGDVVYDPFLGSGTTLIAAEMTGRTCVGLELSPVYVDVIVKRWQSFTGKDAILEGSNEAFAKRAAAVLRQSKRKAA